MRALLAMLGCGLLIGCAELSAPAPSSASEAMRERPERLVIVAVANPRPSGSIVAGSTSLAYATTLQPYAGSGAARSALAAIEREHNLVERTAWPIEALKLHCAVLELAEGATRDEVLLALSQDRRVALAEPLQTFEGLTDGAAYNDPYAPLQHALAEIEAAPAHLASRGHGVEVAIIDTGVDVSHPDLHGRIAGARNLVDADALQFRRDRHGTEVAGVIAAVANNREGIVGIAPEAELRIYKACWQSPDARARCNSFTLALALAASLDDGARVINLSLAGPRDELLLRLLGVALARGRIVVAAVPPDGALDGFPLAAEGVIAVDTSAPRKTATEARVLHAPGSEILTTVPGGHYDFDSGSSLAAAHASGVAALLLALPGSPKPAAVRSALEAGRSETGSLNACIAMAALTHRTEGRCAAR